MKGEAEMTVQSLIERGVHSVDPLPKNNPVELGDLESYAVGYAGKSYLAFTPDAWNRT